MTVATDLAPARRGAPRLEARSWLRTIGRPGPERWVWPVAAAGWAILVWGAVGWHPLGGSAMAAHDHAGMTGHAGMTHPAVSSLAATAGLHLALWAAMIAATMLPLIARSLRAVGLRSPLGRRTRATLEVASGWSLVWLAAGVVVSLALVATAGVVPHALAVGVVCAAAVGWQFTRVRRIALARCHRTFAPPLGRGAASASVGFGLSLGRDCLLSCGASMALMAVAGHQPVVVVALGWLAWRDMRRPHDSPGTATAVAVLIGVGAFAVLTQA